MNPRSLGFTDSAAATGDLTDRVAALSLHRLAPAVADMVTLHLLEPATPVAALIDQASGSLDKVTAAYAFIRTDPAVRAFMRSLYYHHRLRVAFAVATVREWAADPGRPQHILSGKSVVSRTVEIHPSPIKGDLPVSVRHVPVVRPPRTDL